MPKPYNITFTDLAKAAAEASSLAAVEAKARAEIADLFLIDGEVPIRVPPWGFHCFEMPDGQEFILWFEGENNRIEIDTIERHESVGRIEDKAEWLGLSGGLTFPVRATRKK